MRNCFKRYDKANDFNNVSGTANSQTNSGSIPGGLQPNMMPQSQIQQQALSTSGNGQPATSQLIKSGSHHKS